MTQPGRNRPRRAGVSAAMDHSSRLTMLAPFALALLLVGCGSTGASPSPAPTTSPSPTIEPSASPPPVTAVGSPAQAAAVVFAHAGVGRMGPLLPDLIGQSTWYEASEDATGYLVKLTAGAGDCQAGCIERHTWTYHVDFDGSVTLVSDEGDDIGLPPADGLPGQVTLNVLVAAGPVCPVETVPPNPACAPRPLANVELSVFDPAGTLVTTALTGENGRATVELSAGAHYVVAPPLDGIMGQADAQAFAAVAGDTVAMVLMYDTGIR